MATMKQEAEPVERVWEGWVIPHGWFHIPGDGERLGPQIVEIGEVGPRFDRPIRLDKEESYYEEAATPSREERFDLDPGNHIVDIVRDIERHCGAT